MARVCLILLRWKIELRNALEILWESRWAGVLFTSFFVVLTRYLEYRPASPGVAIAWLGAVAALMSLRSKATGVEKANWMLLIACLLVIEFRAIRQDRKEHDEAFANLLSQTMGGDGYPVFLPVFPRDKATPDETWPVQVIYPSEPTADTTPLIDVSVNVEVRPSKGSGTGGFTQEVVDSLFTPAHFSLGNLPRGTFTAPFRLQSGKRYQLAITTRRGFFYENINIDRSPSSPEATAYRGVCIGMQITN